MLLEAFEKNLLQEAVKRAKNDLEDSSIGKPIEIARLDNLQDVGDYLMCMTTLALIKRIKRALNDEVEIRRGGKH